MHSVRGGDEAGRGRGRRPAPRARLLAALLVTLIVAGCDGQTPVAEEDIITWVPPETVTTIQFVSISDWRGSVESFSTDDGVVGGAGLLAGYWARDETVYPTLALATGDAIGISPAIVSLFAELPAVLALRAMGLDVDTFGNHNFDRGIAHLQAMLDAAVAPTLEVPWLEAFFASFANLEDAEPNLDALSALQLPTLTYTVANLTNVPQNLRNLQPYTIRNVGDVPVAVTGLLYEEAPDVVFPGSFGSMGVADPVDAACETRALAAEDGATFFVALAHIPGTDDDDRVLRLEAPAAGTLITLRVAAGDDFEEGDLLFEVEDDKGARSSVEAPHAGRVAEVLVQAGGAVGAAEPVLRVEPQAVRALTDFTAELMRRGDDCRFDLILGDSSPVTIACTLALDADGEGYTQRCAEPGAGDAPPARDLELNPNTPLIIQSPAQGLEYARVEMEVTPATGVVEAWQVEAVQPSEAAFPEGPEAAEARARAEALLAIFEPVKDRLFGVPIAATSGRFEYDPEGNEERLGEYALGNLYADALRYRSDADFGLVNAGGIRDGLPAAAFSVTDPEIAARLRRPTRDADPGPPYHITVGDIHASLPFASAVVLQQVTGEEVWQMVEHSISRLPDPSGRFGHFSGLRFEYDLSQPTGCPDDLSRCLEENQQQLAACQCETSRITGVWRVPGGGEEETPIAPSRNDFYTLATNEFLAQGGDGYIMLTNDQGATAESRLKDGVIGWMVQTFATPRCDPDTCTGACDVWPLDEGGPERCVLSPKALLQGRIQEVAP